MSWFQILLTYNSSLFQPFTDLAEARAVLQRDVNYIELAIVADKAFVSSNSD